MRNWFITLLAMLLAFTACQQEPIVPDSEDSFDPAKLHFNLTIQHPEGTTKGVKSGWENGDKVFIFFPDKNAGYLTATFNGTSWSMGKSGDIEISGEGSFHAVYLPYGNDATASYNDGKWSFSKATDTYYFYASNVAYKVETEVFSATLKMLNPNTYVQFYIPYADASGNIQLACNALRRAVIEGISASEGVVTVNTGSAGTPITGYADILSGEKGYYVSGIPVTVASETADYYFAIKVEDSYSHYYKNRSALVANKAYRLPEYSNWPAVGGSSRMRVANVIWKTVNEGADNPWDIGVPKNNSFPPSSEENIPSDTDWSNLMDSQKATWIPMDIWGSHGSLVLSVSAPNKYIYIPWSTSSASYYWSKEFLSSLQINTEGTHSLIDTGIPENAYVRTVFKRNWFRIIAEASGTITTTQSGVQYSTDYGEHWTALNNGLSVSSGDEVFFRANTKTWASKTLKSSGIFRVAGDIASLLVGDDFDKGTAEIPSGYSFADFFKGCTQLTDASELVLSMSFAPSFSFKSFFEACTNLKAGPKELSATTVNETCYRNMFSGCKSLTSAPIIRNPSEHNGKGWYQRMFYDCSSLNEIVFLDQYTYNSESFTDWVKGVASPGTLYVNNADTDNPFAGQAAGANACPQGWTVATYNP